MNLTRLLLVKPVRLVSRSLKRTPVVASAFKFLLIIASIGLSMAGTAQADTNITWLGGTSGTWTTGGNWQGGSAPANSLTTNGAYFNSFSYGNQPNTGTTSIGSIEFGASNTGSTLNISGTQLTLGNAGTLVSGANTGILVDAGSRVSNISVTTIKLGQTTNIWKNNSSFLLNISSAISSNVTGATLSITGTGTGGTTLSGVISDGAGPLAVAIGTNTFGNVTTLSGSNTFTGGLAIVDNGGSSVAFTGALSATSGAVTANPLGEGTVSLGAGTSTLNYTSGPGGFINNAITLANGGNINFGNTSGNTVNYSGSITGTIGNADSLTISGSSSTIFSGANTYTGSTVVTGNLTLAGSSSGSSFSTSGSGTFTESSTGVISGTGSFTQGSTSTSTLAGANSYSGPTAVNAGKLALQGSLNPATALSVGAGANFAVGQAAGGSSFLSQTVSTLALTSTGGVGSGLEAVLAFNLGAGNDSLVSSGAFTLTGSSFNLNLTGTGSGTDTLLTWLDSGSTAITTGNIDLTLNGISLGLSDPELSIMNSGGNDFLEFTATAVPEPSTWAMMFGGGLLLILIQSRRRRSS